MALVLGLGASPSMRISPSEGVSRPLASLIRVVFPLPLGPSRPITRPGSSFRLMLSSAAVFPKRLLSSLHSKIGISYSSCSRAMISALLYPNVSMALRKASVCSRARARLLLSITWVSSVTKRPAVRWE